LELFDDVLVKSFVPHALVVILDLSVFLRLSELDVLNYVFMFLGPYQRYATKLYSELVEFWVNLAYEPVLIVAFLLYVWAFIWVFDPRAHNISCACILNVFLYKVTSLSRYHEPAQSLVDGRRQG
jgi:hypothetical protein